MQQVSVGAAFLALSAHHWHQHLCAAIAVVRSSTVGEHSVVVAQQSRTDDEATEYECAVVSVSLL